MIARIVTANEATAAQRRVYFHCVDATDGITPETGEAAGQPQISTNGAAFTNTGIGTLTHLGNGRYYADITQAAVATAGDWIETRYKSANTAESIGTSVHVWAIDPLDGVRLGLTALPNAAAGANGGLPTGDASARVALQPASIQAIWDALTTALTTVGSIGKRLADNIDAAISSRSTYAGADPAGVTTLLTRLTSTRANLLDNVDAAISTRATASDLAVVDALIDTLIVRVPSALTITTGKVDVNDKTGFSLSNGSIAAATFASDAITDAKVASDMDTYQAKVWVQKDGANDRYTIVFFKNGQPVLTGITDEEIQVIKMADGTDLVAAIALTEVGSTGLFKHVESTNQTVDGQSYIVKLAATIDGSSREWYCPYGRNA
jgi:hypothetical protein